MTKKVTNGGNRIQNQQLKGATLAAIDKDRIKVGCVDPNSPGKRYYGLTAATIEVIPDQIIPIFQNMTTMGASATVKFKGVEVKYSAVTTICVPTEKAKLSKKAKAEWDRFEKEVITHEAKHFDDTKAMADKIAEEVFKLSVTGKARTLEEAGVAAAKALKAKIQKDYGPTQLQIRIDKKMKDRDGDDRHGARSGAKLKTSVT